MEKIKSKSGLLRLYKNSSIDVQKYFNELELLLEGGFSLDVVLAYVFSRVETAHVNCLYCGAVKIHRVDSELARRAMQKFHMTRDGFREKFRIIYDKPIPDAIIKVLVFAEAVRDAVLHGKEGTDEQKRNAVAHVLSYASLLNEHCATLNAPLPFGSLRGFKGAAQGLEKRTSKWVLLGMGFFRQGMETSVD